MFALAAGNTTTFGCVGENKISLTQMAPGLFLQKLVKTENNEPHSHSPANSWIMITYIQQTSDNYRHFNL